MRIEGGQVLSLTKENAESDLQEKKVHFFNRGQRLSGAAFDLIFSGERFAKKRYGMRGHGRSGTSDTSEGLSQSIMWMILQHL